MSTTDSNIERRREVRLDCGDTIRWKRPGRVEDNKGWTIDRSSSGLGFMVRADLAPAVGESLHVRKRITNNWATLDESLRVARIEPVNDNLVVVGCAID